MRSVCVVLLSLLLALSACEDGATPCDVGPDIVSDAVQRVMRDQPVCTRDDECVTINLDVRCTGYSVVGCGDIVHRDAVARWDASAVCRAIDRASVPSNLWCIVESSCAGSGNAVCRSGRCTGDER